MTKTPIESILALQWQSEPQYEQLVGAQHLNLPPEQLVLQRPKARKSVRHDRQEAEVMRQAAMKG